MRGLLKRLGSGLGLANVGGNGAAQHACMVQGQSPAACLVHI